MGVAIKKTVSLSPEIVKEAIEFNPNFSQIVESALIMYIHEQRIKRAVESFGKWEKRDDTSVNLVNELRREKK